MMLTLVLSTNMIYAADNRVTFLNKADEFFVYPLDKDLFTNFKDVMPGDTLVQPITIRNDSGNTFSIKMYMKVYPIAEEYLDFLSQMIMSLENDGVLFYRDNINNTFALEEYILLAELKPGDYIDLDVTLEVPLELTNEYAYTVGELDWEFMVEEIELPPEVLEHEPEDPKTPTTGINANAMPYIIVVGLSSIALVFTKKRKRQ